MKNFTDFSFYMYTDILFGKNTEKQAGTKIRQYGGTKVMIVYGCGSIKKIGLYQTVIESLNKEGIPFIELAGVQPNPVLSFVIKGLDKAMKEGVDFLLGVAPLKKDWGLLHAYPGSSHSVSASLESF